MFIDMKRLTIKKLSQQPLAAADIPAIMDAEQIPFELIDNANWAADYPYTPKASFRMGHHDDTIYLHYRVSEDSVRALAAQDNGHVWEDSCCEFFFQPTPDGPYYNVECNCAGTLLVGCGQGRESRALASGHVLRQIDRWTTLGRAPFEERKGRCEWQLALIIPTSTFFNHQIGTVSGQDYRANFYKCGDALEKPHFLSWNAIEIAKPDFHRPDYFGDLSFE